MPAEARLGPGSGSTGVAGSTGPGTVAGCSGAPGVPGSGSAGVTGSSGTAGVGSSEGWGTSIRVVCMTAALPVRAEMQAATQIGSLIVGRRSRSRRPVGPAGQMLGGFGSGGSGVGSGEGVGGWGSGAGGVGPGSTRTLPDPASAAGVDRLVFTVWLYPGRRWRKRGRRDGVRREGTRRSGGGSYQAERPSGRQTSQESLDHLRVELLADAAAHLPAGALM
jgi:hypothetical protein